MLCVVEILSVVVTGTLQIADVIFHESDADLLDHADT